MAALPEHEQRDEHGGSPRKPSVYGLSQAWLAVLMSPQVSAPRPAVMSTVPTMSRLWVVVSRDSTTAHDRRGGRDDADGDVHPEHGRPREVLDQEPAEERADRETEARDAGPDADGLGKLLARERRHDDRERERVQERAAHALDRAGADQLRVGLGQRAAGRGQVKIARPRRKIRFRPYRSPSLPPSRISVANTRT